MKFETITGTVFGVLVFSFFAILANSLNTALRPSAINPNSPDRGTGQVSEEDFAEYPQPPTLVSPELPDLFIHGLRSDKLVALTFDACPAGQSIHYSDSIAKTLISTGTPATIFLSGEWIKSHKTEVRFLAGSPLFEFGNHSYSHPHMRNLTEDKIKAELLYTQDLINQYTGQKASLFRAPFGEYNDTLVCAAHDIGLTTVQFDLASGDPDSSFTAARLTRYVTAEAKNGSIIVMHINGRGWHTAEALPTLITSLEERGFEFVKVSRLLKRFAVGQKPVEEYKEFSAILSSQERFSGEPTRHQPTSQLLRESGEDTSSPQSRYRQR